MSEPLKPANEMYPHFDPKTHMVTICEHSPITAEMVMEADACWAPWDRGTYWQHMAEVLNRLQGKKLLGVPPKEAK